MSNTVVEAHYREHSAKLIKRYTRPLGSEQASEDVVHEAYARALKYFDRWDQTQPFEPWFAGLIKNAFRDQLSENRGITFEPIEDFDFTTIADTSRIDDLKEALRVEIAKEPEDRQIVLKLYFFGGYTGREISHVTPFTQGNIRKMIYQFRHKFLKDYKYST